MAPQPKSAKKPEIPEPELNLKALPPIEAMAFRDLLGKSWIARELILPQGRAAWDGERYSFGQADHSALIPTVSGVRFQEPDPHRIDGSRERGCQADLVALVATVAELRKQPQLGNLVLGLNKDVVIGEQAGDLRCKRGLFGLACPAGPRFESEVEAAGYCHQQVIRAGKKAGFTLREEVPSFDQRTGFKGLMQWAERVRWKQGWRPPWFLLLLFLPLLFLPVCCINLADAKPAFFGAEVETDSVLILIDRSPSTDDFIKNVPKEAKRFLAAFRKKHNMPYGNIITYTKEPHSILGGIRPLNDKKNADKIEEELKELKAMPKEEIPANSEKGEFTNLKNALKKAAEEIAKHPEPTTVVILTDGVDRNLKELLENEKAVFEQFNGKLKGVRFVMPAPKNETDKLFQGRVADLQHKLNGRAYPPGAALPGIIVLPSPRAGGPGTGGGTGGGSQGGEAGSAPPGGSNPNDYPNFEK